MSNKTASISRRSSGRRWRKSTTPTSPPLAPTARVVRSGDLAVLCADVLRDFDLRPVLPALRDLQDFMETPTAPYGVTQF